MDDTQPYSLEMDRVLAAKRETRNRSFQSTSCDRELRGRLVGHNAADCVMRRAWVGPAGSSGTAKGGCVPHIAVFRRAQKTW